MLLSAAFPVGLWRVGGRLHQSLYLESSNHGNCAVLMCEANEKTSGHQNLSRNRHLTGQDMTVFLFKTRTDGWASENLPETRKWIMNRLLQEDCSGLSLRHLGRSFDPLLKDKKKTTPNQMIFFNKMHFSISKWKIGCVRLSLTANTFFNIGIWMQRRPTEHVVRRGGYCCVLLPRWSLLAWSWHYALHMGSVGTEAEARSKGQSLLQADL